MTKMMIMVMAFVQKPPPTCVRRPFYYVYSIIEESYEIEHGFVEGSLKVMFGIAACSIIFMIIIAMKTMKLRTARRYCSTTISQDEKCTRDL